MKKLVLAVLVLLGLVFWLQPRREREPVRASPDPEAHAEEPVPAVPLETPAVPSEPRILSMPEVVHDAAEASAQGLDAPVEPGSQIVVSFHGRALDALTQRPLGGVRALIARAKWGARPEELAPEEIACEASSDAEGWFELPLTAERGVELGYLLADGYGAASFKVEDAHGSRSSALVLELLPESALEVDVTHAGGAPVHGARVELVRPAEHLVGANSMLMTPALSWVEHTDEAGRAGLERLPAEVELAWTVLLERDSRGRAGHVAIAPGETRRLEVVLGSDARIFGHVRDEEGAPVAGLELWLAQADAADRRAKEAVAKARSDESGRFEFAGVPFETFVLGPAPGAREFVARGHEVIVVDRPIVEHDLVIARGLFIEGRVTGSPVEIEELGFLNVQRLDGSYVDSDTLDGSVFRIGPFAPGEYLLSAAGVNRGTAIVQVAAGASDVELPLLEPRELRLSIEGSAGPFELRVRDVSRGPIWMWTETDALSVLPLVPGRFALLVTAPGDLLGYLAFELHEQASVEELRVRLDPGARCTFVHRASEGTRTLHLLLDGAPFVSDYLTDSALAAGSARTLLVPPRPLVAELREGTRVVARESLTPAPGERLRVELVPR